MKRFTGFVVLAGMALAAAACGCGGAVKAPPSAPAPAPRTAGGVERVPEVCRATQQRPAPGEPDGPDAPLPLIAPEPIRDAAPRGGVQFTDDYRNGAPLVATVRVLSTAPFLFRGVGGTDEVMELGPYPFSGHVVRPAAATKLRALRFGEIVTVEYLPPPTMNSVPPLVITDVRREPLAAIPVPLLVEWMSPGAELVRVYADGRVLAALPEEQVEWKLSHAELRAFLATFGRAGFDALPSAPDGMQSVGLGEVVLDCARHQRVVAAEHREAGPVVAALEALLAGAKARQAPILVVEQSIPDVIQLEWPAEAPAVADLQRLHDEAHARGRKNDDPSPLFRPLPPAFAKAFAEGRTPGHKSIWLLRDHGKLWMIGDRLCAYGDPVCHLDSLDMVQIDRPVQPAPEWAPDLSKIGADGVYYDRVKDARWLELHGWYAQGNGLYLVEQRVHTAPAKP
jgi:hypothetical protein